MGGAVQRAGSRLGHVKLVKSRWAIVKPADLAHKIQQKVRVAKEWGGLGGGRHVFVVLRPGVVVQALGSPLPRARTCTAPCQFPCSRLRARAVSLRLEKICWAAQAETTMCPRGPGSLWLFPCKGGMAMAKSTRRASNMSPKRRHVECAKCSPR